MDFRQLLPKSATVEIPQLLAGMGLIGRAHAHRPYTIVNFISSVDGRAAFHGRSGGLSDAGDRAIFHGLRERVDAVFVGNGTLRAEQYRRLVRDSERIERRAAAGLAPQPLAVLMSRTGDIPMEIPMFEDPDSRIVLFTPKAHDTSECKADVEVVHLDPGELTLTTMMQRLRTDHDIRVLLCEGGPTVFGALLQEQLADELFLTVAPKLTGGGTDPTITSGPALTELVPLELVWALEREGTLFLRYAIS